MLQYLFPRAAVGTWHGEGRGWEGSKSQPGGKVGKAMLERRDVIGTMSVRHSAGGQKKECRSMFIPYPQLTWILWRSLGSMNKFLLWTGTPRGEIPREVPYLECGSQSGAFSSCYHSVYSPMKIKEPFLFSSLHEDNRKFLTQEVFIEYPSTLWMVLGIEIKHEKDTYRIVSRWKQIPKRL